MDNSTGLFMTNGRESSTHPGIVGKKARHQGEAALIDKKRSPKDEKIHEEIHEEKIDPWGHKARVQKRRQAKDEKATWKVKSSCCCGCGVLTQKPKYVRCHGEEKKRGNEPADKKTQKKAERTGRESELRLKFLHRDVRVPRPRNMGNKVS